MIKNVSSYQNSSQTQSKWDPEECRRLCAVDATGVLICRCAGSGRSWLSAGGVFTTPEHLAKGRHTPLYSICTKSVIRLLTKSSAVFTSLPLLYGVVIPNQFYYKPKQCTVQLRQNKLTWIRWYNEPIDFQEYFSFHIVASLITIKPLMCLCY